MPRPLRCLKLRRCHCRRWDAYKTATISHCKTCTAKQWTEMTINNYAATLVDTEFRFTLQFGTTTKQQQSGMN